LDLLECFIKGSLAAGQGFFDFVARLVICTKPEGVYFFGCDQIYLVPNKRFFLVFVVLFCHTEQIEAVLCRHGRWVIQKILCNTRPVIVTRGMLAFYHHTQNQNECFHFFFPAVMFFQKKQTLWKRL
jgi:hypothetical protein